MGQVDSGYGLTRECFSENKCDFVVKGLLTGKIIRSRAGARHLMSNPGVSALANDSRMIELAREWVGPVAIPFRATLFEKSKSTNWLIPWHQDTALPLAARAEMAGWGPWSAKAGVTYAHAPAWALSRVIALRVHLDASQIDHGPLRVVPGSHLAGVLSDEQVKEVVMANEGVECCVPQGGVIAMRPLLIHCSSKAETDCPRRVLHIEYVDCLDLARGMQLAVV